MRGGIFNHGFEQADSDLRNKATLPRAYRDFAEFASTLEIAGRWRVTASVSREMLQTGPGNQKPVIFWKEEDSMLESYPTK